MTLTENLQKLPWILPQKKKTAGLNIPKIWWQEGHSQEQIMKCLSSQPQRSRGEKSPQDICWYCDGMGLRLLACLTALCQMCIVGTYCTRTWWQVSVSRACAQCCHLFVLTKASHFATSPWWNQPSCPQCFAETHHKLKAIVLLKRKKNLKGEKDTAEQHLELAFCDIF